MVSRKESAQRRAERNQAELRYHKQRQRNVMALPGAHPFVVILDHLKSGPNVPKIFRSAEVFGAREVHLINIGLFDPAPAKGAFRKVPARFMNAFEQSYRQLTAQDYRIYVLQPGAGASLFDITLERNAAFVFGHEEHGIQFNMNDYPDLVPLHIPQFGQVQSLNVSVAASVVMYEYVRQHTHNPLADYSITDTK